MTIVLALFAGAALGAVLARGDFCFHSTWRRLFAEPRSTSLLRAYLVLLVVSTPFVQLFIAVDLIDPFIPPFAPWAAILGGGVFGVGMVVAQTCVSGMFYKLGSGMLGMVVAIAAWAVGDLLVWRWSLTGLRESLTDNPVTTTADDGTEQVATVTSLLGPVGAILVILAGLAIAAWVLRDEATERPSGNLSGIRLGLITGAVMVVAWLLVRWHGFDYSYGTSSVPAQVWGKLFDDASISWWIPLALVSVIPGAFLAAAAGDRLWFRGENAQRYGQLAVGGLIMGAGAGIAGGCNLGHSMVGVPLLSIGSIVTTLAIVAGVFVAHHAARLLAAGS